MVKSGKKYLVTQYTDDGAPYSDVGHTEYIGIFDTKELAETYCKERNEITDVSDLQFDNVWSEWDDYAYKHYFDDNKGEYGSYVWEDEEATEVEPDKHRALYAEWVTKVKGVKSDKEINKYLTLFQCVQDYTFYYPCDIQEVDYYIGE